MTSITRDLLDHEKYLLNKINQINKVSRNISGNVHVKGIDMLKEYNNNPSKRILYVGAHHWSLADFILATYKYLNEDIEVPFTLGGDNLYARFMTKEQFGFSILPDFVKAGMIPIPRGKRKQLSVSGIKEVHNRLLDVIKNRGNIKTYNKGGRNKDGLLRPFNARIIEYFLDEIKDSKDKWDLIIETSSYDEVPEIETLEKTVRINKEKPPLYKARVIMTDLLSFKYHKQNGAAENEVHLTYHNPVSIKDLFEENNYNSKLTAQAINNIADQKQKLILITPTSIVASMMKYYEPSLLPGEMITTQQAKKYFSNFFNKNSDTSLYSNFIKERMNDSSMWNDIIDRGIFCLNKGEKQRFANKTSSGFRAVKPENSKTNKMEKDNNQVINYYANQIAHFTENNLEEKLQ